MDDIGIPSARKIKLKLLLVIGVGISLLIVK
jgi:hypothetical protein